MEKSHDLASGSQLTSGGSGIPISDTPSAGVLYQQHAPLLRRVAIRRYGIPPADVDGLVHDVFINYLATTRRVRGELRNYLIGAICNAARNYWRSRRTEGRVFVADNPDTIDPSSEKDLFDGLAANLIVASTLAALRPRCREALRRYYIDGEDTRTIAEAMKTTASNVNYIMHTCRKRAREIYEEISRTR